MDKVPKKIVEFQSIIVNHKLAKSQYAYRGRECAFNRPVRARKKGKTTRLGGKAGKMPIHILLG
jgi:hypothetical protein